MFNFEDIMGDIEKKEVNRDFATIAECSMILYQSYINVGFDEERAMEFTIELITGWCQ